jgi:hypothetical protein
LFVIPEGNLLLAFAFWFVIPQRSGGICFCLAVASSSEGAVGFSPLNSRKMNMGFSPGHRHSSLSS